MVDGEGFLGLDPDALGVGAEGGYADACGGGAHVGVHDFACLVVHLHLLLGVVVGGHLVDLRDDVVGELVGELIDGLGFARLDEFLVLLLELGHGSCTGAACALVAGYVYFLDVRELLDGLKHHYHHDGGAVGVGDNAARAVEGVGGVALGDNQGHVVVHAEGAGVVDHDGAILGDVWRELFGDTGTG